MSDAETVSFRVDGMTCDHCKAAVTKEVQQVAGVHAVAVDLDSKIVQVSGEDLDRTSLAAAIDEAGYDAADA